MTEQRTIPVTLLRKALTFTQLNMAFERVAQDDGAPGSDGQTIDQFGIRLAERLRTLRNEVIGSRYQPLPLLRIWLPRPNKSPRPLAIPAVRDRVLQTVNGQKLDLRRIIDAQVQLLCKAIRHPQQTAYQACVFRE